MLKISGLIGIYCVLSMGKCLAPLTVLCLFKAKSLPTLNSRQSNLPQYLGISINLQEWGCYYCISPL